MGNHSTFHQVIKKNEEGILINWLGEQLGTIGHRRDLIRDSELKDQSNRFLSVFSNALQTGNLTDIHGKEWNEAREVLSEVSKKRTEQGFSPSETAQFVFSLKKPIMDELRRSNPSIDELFEATLTTNRLLDSLGLYTGEVYQKTREAIILRQQEEMLELSTPVVKLWDGVLGLPMIGTLDSARTQVVMESLLLKIVEAEADVAIIDITGVPTVDTLVAQHLIKTVTAARLMGAECIISGIRPQIAQTIVHLGVDLGDITTKANLADAFAVALTRRGLRVAPALSHSKSH